MSRKIYITRQKVTVLHVRGEETRKVVGRTYLNAGICRHSCITVLITHYFPHVTKMGTEPQGVEVTCEQSFSK